MKISILALHMGYGGIEKSIVTLANLLATKKNYEVEIISIYKLYDALAFELNEKVKITYLLDTDLPLRVEEYKLLLKHFHFLKLFHKLWQNYFSKLKLISFFRDAFGGLSMYSKRKRVMKKAILKSDADVLISTRTFLNELLGVYGKDSALKIGWEHNHYHNNMRYATDVVRSAKKLDYFVLVSKELERFYRRRLYDYPVKCVYIPNTLDKIPKKKSSLTEKRIISVGRLSPEKGYLDLLKIYNEVRKKYPDWHLDIVGDGKEKEALKAYIKENKLKDFVTLHGFQNSTYINDLMQRSSIYVMTSFTESFGIVLLEAMSNGLPCLAFDSAEGAREIITSGRDGYLIRNRNKDIMEKKIFDLIKDEKRRKELGAMGRKKIKLYSKDKVLEAWIKVIEKKGQE